MKSCRAMGVQLVRVHFYFLEFDVWGMWCVYESVVGVGVVGVGGVGCELLYERVVRCEGK